jgi:hypothetical protein
MEIATPVKSFVQLVSGHSGQIIRRKALGVFIFLLVGILIVARSRFLRQSQPTLRDASLPGQARQMPLNSSALPSSSASTAVATETDRADTDELVPASWKRWRSAEYGFEIVYPGDWMFDASFEDNIGKPPSGKQAPAFAGDTRNLFDLEFDGPQQSHEGGGSFDDGVVINVRITGTAASIEDWGIAPGRPPYLVHSTLSDWVKLQSSPFSGDEAKKVAINTNRFTGEIELACSGTNPCVLWGEAGGAYRQLPSGRVLFISWNRMAGGNDCPYQKYFLPMLSSVKLLE